MALGTAATLEDLYAIEDHGKAELVDGQVVIMSPTGYLPNRAAGTIYISLRQYETQVPDGHALTDNAGFTVDLPHRKSFSPDAAFYIGPPSGGKFLPGAPIFAVEVRSEGDYGPTSEASMARKRADYFAVGTEVVWDVDVLEQQVVRVYRASDPEQPTVYHRGEVAEAEPALPGWRLLVEELFH